MEDNAQGSPPAEPAPKKRRGRGRPKLVEEENPVTETMRKRVESMAGLGHTEEEIALIMAIDLKTFRKYFLKAYKTGAIKAVYNAASIVYQQAVVERDKEQLRYFLSHRAEQWRDKQKVELSGSVSVDSPLNSLLGRLKDLGDGDKGSLASDEAGEPGA